MTNRPSQGAVSVYAASADGNYYLSYPQGNANTQGAALAGPAAVAATAGGQLATGAGFNGAVATAVAIALGILANSAPGRPTNVVATPGNAQASVAFTAPVQNGGRPITSYKVTASTGQTATGPTTPINVLGLANGTLVTFTVQAINSVGTGNASAASNAVTPVAGTAGYDGTWKRGSGANSSQFVNSSGSVIQMRGFNVAGLESSAAQQTTDWYGTPPNWTYAGTLKANCVRIPLNAASWLGLTCNVLNGSGNGWSATNQLADYSGTYRATVIAAVRAAQAQGLYVIIDLHWSAPKFTFGGVTAYCMPLWQPAFMNSDTDGLFWTSIAQMFGTQATPQSGINNAGVAFELVNEPTLDIFNGSNATATWNLMRNGGAASSFATNYATTAVSQGWTVYGYQQALNAIRATGATNVILIGGCGYSHALSGYATYMPADTLTPSQVALTMHPYPSGTYPYSDGDVYGLCYPDNNNGTAQWATYMLAAIAAGIPVIWTETGGSYGPQCTAGEPHVTYMTKFADANNVAGAIAWTYWDGNPGRPTSGANGLNYITTTSNAPTTGQGAVFCSWMANHGGAVNTVPGPPTNVTLVAGNGQVTCSFTAPTNTGGAAITQFTVTLSNGLNASGTSSPIGVTSPNGTAVTATVTATNSVGIGSSSAVSNSVTPTAGGTGATVNPPVNLTLKYIGVTSFGQSGSPNAPPAPNSSTITWSPGANGTNGAPTAYNIQRSTNGGAYTRIASAVASTTYVDNAASQCASSTAGSGPQYYVCNTYLYQVQAIDSAGNVSAWSNTQNFWIYKNGYNWGGDFDNVATSNYADTSGNPVGGGTDIKVQLQGQYGETLMYAGGSTTLYQQWVGAFTYLEFDMKITQANPAFQVYCLRSGDVNIYGSNGQPYNRQLSSYATLTVGNWVHVKIPLADIITDYGPGGGSSSVRQNAFYKYAVQDQSGSSNNVWYYNNIQFT